MSPKLRSLVLVLVGVALIASLFARGTPRSALVDEPAPDFTLPIAFGEGQGEDRVRLSDLRGKLVVLDFWASWCGPCKRSVPELSALAVRYQSRGVLFYGINSESIGPGLLAFIGTSWGFRYPILRDERLQAAMAYHVDAYPSVFLVDSKGIVRTAWFGAPTQAELSREIDNLLR